jgi:hypothetical protein
VCVAVPGYIPQAARQACRLVQGVAHADMLSCDAVLHAVALRSCPGAHSTPRYWPALASTGGCWCGTSAGLGQSRCGHAPEHDCLPPGQSPLGDKGLLASTIVLVYACSRFVAFETVGGSNPTVACAGVMLKLTGLHCCVTCCVCAGPRRPERRRRRPP